MSTSHSEATILFQSLQDGSIILPPLFCPSLPSVRNDHADQVHTHSLQWAITCQLVQPQSKQLARLNAAQLAWVAARINPDFRYEQLALFTDWLIWGICYDDLCDADNSGRDPLAWGALIRRLMAVVREERQPAPTEPLAVALADLCQRLRQQTTPHWLDRFAYDLQQSFQSNRWEAAMRAGGVTPDLATYTKMRPLTSAVAPCLDLMAICAGVDSEAGWLDHAYLQQLRMMLTNHLCWVNDLFGLAREIKENNQNNLVLVLQHEYQLSLQAAVDRVVDLCNAEMKAFLALGDLFSGEEDGMTADCRCYIDRLRSWICGNLDWYSQTGRYRSTSLESAKPAG